MISSPKQYKVSVSAFSNKPVSAALSAGAEAEYVKLDLFSTKVSSKKAEN